jgi:ribosomal protein S18 acetylase RimI-like enzyme
MKERELGSMQIAGVTIRVVETTLGPETLSQPRVRFMLMAPSIPLLWVELNGTLICSEWYARIGEKDVAWAVLLENVKDRTGEGVAIYAAVDDANRRLGLGRFMIRLGTDQAIRYRKRTILAEAENTNEAALKIMDEEEFEVQPEQHPGFTLLKKELKWT